MTHTLFKITVHHDWKQSLTIGCCWLDATKLSGHMQSMGSTPLLLHTNCDCILMMQLGPLWSSYVTHFQFLPSPAHHPFSSSGSSHESPTLNMRPVPPPKVSLKKFKVLKIHVPHLLPWSFLQHLQICFFKGIRIH